MAKSKMTNGGSLLILGIVLIYLLAQSAAAEQLQVRCDTLYSGIKPMSVADAANLLTTIGKSEFRPLVDDEDFVELRLEVGQGCDWYANIDIESGKPLAHGERVELGKGDSVLAFIDVEGAPAELGLLPGSDWPLQMQNGIALLALTENEAVTRFWPSWKLMRHEFTSTGNPVDYPEAKARARDYSARFFNKPIALRPGKGTVTVGQETMLTWEIGGFQFAETTWRGTWATIGDIAMANETASVRCQGSALGRTSKEPGLSAIVHQGPLANLEFNNLLAGQLNQDCVYQWEASAR